MAFYSQTVVAVVRTVVLYDEPKFSHYMDARVTAETIFNIVAVGSGLVTYGLVCSFSDFRTNWERKDERLRPAAGAPQTE